MYHFIIRLCSYLSFFMLISVPYALSSREDWEWEEFQHVARKIIKNNKKSSFSGLIEKRASQFASLNFNQIDPLSRAEKKEETPIFRIRADTLELYETTRYADPLNDNYHKDVIMSENDLEAISFIQIPSKKKKPKKVGRSKISMPGELYTPMENLDVYQREIARCENKKIIAELAVSKSIISRVVEKYFPYFIPVNVLSLKKRRVRSKTVENIDIFQESTKKHSESFLSESICYLFDSESEKSLSSASESSGSFLLEEKESSSPWQIYEEGIESLISRYDGASLPDILSRKARKIGKKTFVSKLIKHAQHMKKLAQEEKIFFQSNQVVFEKLLGNFEEAGFLGIRATTIVKGIDEQLKGLKQAKNTMKNIPIFHLKSGELKVLSMTEYPNPCSCKYHSDAKFLLYDDTYTFFNLTERKKRKEKIIAEFAVPKSFRQKVLQGYFQGIELSAKFTEPIREGYESEDSNDEEDSEEALLVH